MFTGSKPDITLVVHTNVSDRAAEPEFCHIRDGACIGIDETEAVFGAVEKSLILIRILDVTEISMILKRERSDFFEVISVHLKFFDLGRGRRNKDLIRTCGNRKIISIIVVFVFSGVQKKTVSYKKESAAVGYPEDGPVLHTD